MIKYDGWHCLSKRQTQEILKKARTLFGNANFIDNTGLLIEDENELQIHKFCLDIADDYQKSFGGWNGYIIEKLSKKIQNNFNDRKRKLNINYFKKLITDEDPDDIYIVLAGKLYLSPDETCLVIKNFEKDFNCKLKSMDENELKKLYRFILMYSSAKDRKFSLIK